MDSIKFIWFKMSQYLCNLNENLSCYSILVCHQDKMTAWKLRVFVTLEQETVCGENDCLHYVSYFNKSIYSKATVSHFLYNMRNVSPMKQELFFRRVPEGKCRTRSGPNRPAAAIGGAISFGLRFLDTFGVLKLVDRRWRNHPYFLKEIFWSLFGLENGLEGQLWS